LLQSPTPLLVFSFFLMLRHPLRSTLFPYTTLFRSRRGEIIAEVRLAHDTLAPYVRELAETSFDPAQRARRFLARLSFADIAQARDRKSTRLNSSHVEISYAVFCLKKKNKMSI